MKVTKSTTHKIAVDASCGCVVAREFTDAHYTTPIGSDIPSPCPAHADNAAVAEMLLEFLDKEVNDAKAVQPLRTIVGPGEGGVEEFKSLGPIAVPNSAAMDLQKRFPVGQHRPPQGKAASSGSQGIRLVDPKKGMSPGAASHLAHSKLAASAAQAVDIGDEVPEDLRITNLLESVMPLLSDEEGI